jgi:hypothetical protein
MMVREVTAVSDGTLKPYSHIPCRAPTVSCRANSHIPCRAPAILRQCRFLLETSSIFGKIRTAYREISRGSRKKTNLDRSPAGRRETVDVNSHITCRAPDMLCHGLKQSLTNRDGRSTARARHGMCELAFMTLANSLCELIRCKELTGSWSIDRFCC